MSFLRLPQAGLVAAPMFLVPLAAAIPLACNGPVVDLCEQEAKARCSFAYSCCEDDERIERGLNGGNYANSESECVERTAYFCKVFSRDTDQSISRGRQSFDDEAKQKCIEALNKAKDDCDIEDFLTAQSNECGVDFTAPEVDGGDDCSLSAECKSGTCTIDRDKDGKAKDVDDDGIVIGECEKGGEKGDDCIDGECGQGFFCDTDGKCAAQKGKGDDCTSFDQCEPPLQCDGTECKEPEVDLDDKYCKGKD